MKTYRAGASAPYGLYFSGRPLDVHFVGADGEVLQGNPDARYRKLPNVLVVAVGPLIGGVFVMAFPLVVLAAVAWALARMTAHVARRVAERHGHLVRLEWEPSVAYLHGAEKTGSRNGHGTSDGATSPDGDAPDSDLDPTEDALTTLEEEVARRLAEERDDGEQSR